MEKDSLALSTYHIRPPSSQNTQNRAKKAAWKAVKALKYPKEEAFAPYY
jgi:hypothetical protein